MLRKIVAIGPESTGKSILCEQLAGHFTSGWCPEYAREYLLTNGKEYGYDDLLNIAQGQVSLEENSIAVATQNQAASLFIDTDMYVMKVWSEFVFNKCHPYILRQIVERKYDLYLLCNTDIPWTKDELREYPDLVTRNRLFKMYKDLMVHQDVPWVEIRGQNEERLQQAIQVVNGILS